MLSWLGKLLGAAPAESAADPGALIGEARAEKEAGRADRAERLLYRALALTPAAPEIHLLLGELFRAQGRRDAALQCCLEAVRCAPHYAAAHNNLGSAYREVADFANAEAAYRQALSLNPALPEAHFNLGVLLQKRGQDAAALDCYRAALRSRPDFALAHLNAGLVLEELPDVDGAIEAYSAAVRSDPELVEARVNLGMQLLLAGRLAEGWPAYEWRLRYPEYSGADLAAKAVRWQGEPLQGRTILLDAEQGFGDAIQFLRYVPLVAARGGMVLVRCAPELRTLVQRMPGLAAVADRGSTLPPFDCYCPLPSLPQVFGTRLDSIPAKVPYLSVDPAKLARWQARLAADGDGPKIGLVWASQSLHRTAAEKSVGLAALAPLAQVAGVRYYSLQKGDAASESRRTPGAMQVADLSGELQDFSETAAVLQALDGLVTVDTSVAHLAGALGRPAWALLKAAPDWRWLLGREDSPWYPTMRLYRQERAGEWSAPVARLVRDLRSQTAA